MTNRAGSHPSDGELVRYLDTELSQVEERRLRHHLDACERCEGRAEELRRQSLRAQAVLRALAVDVVPDELARRRAVQAATSAAGHRRRGRGWWGAAAAVAVLAVIGVPPLRAWVADFWPRAAVEKPAVVAPAILPAATVERLGSPIAFETAGAEFEIIIDRSQMMGALVVRGVRGERASAQVVNGEGESMLVLPAGLRIENSAESRASYRVAVPAGQRVVRVVVEGREVARIDAANLDGPWSRRIPLKAAVEAP